MDDEGLWAKFREKLDFAKWGIDKQLISPIHTFQVDAKLMTFLCPVVSCSVFVRFNTMHRRHSFTQRRDLNENAWSSGLIHVRDNAYMRKYSTMIPKTVSPMTQFFGSIVLPSWRYLYSAWCALLSTIVLA